MQMCKFKRKVLKNTTIMNNLSRNKPKKPQKDTQNDS